MVCCGELFPCSNISFLLAHSILATCLVSYPLPTPVALPFSLLLSSSSSLRYTEVIATSTQAFTWGGGRGGEGGAVGPRNQGGTQR